MPCGWSASAISYGSRLTRPRWSVHKVVEDARQPQQHDTRNGLLQLRELREEHLVVNGAHEGGLCVAAKGRVETAVVRQAAERREVVDDKLGGVGNGAELLSKGRGCGARRQLGQAARGGKVPQKVACHSRPWSARPSSGQKSARARKIIARVGTADASVADLWCCSKNFTFTCVKLVKIATGLPADLVKSTTRLHCSSSTSI